MTPTQATILGIVEGLTEFLPVSSTGHLMIFQAFWGLGDAAFSPSFTIAIQCGAIAAVVAVYWRSFFVERAVMGRIVVALVPTLFLGFLLYGVVRNYLLVNLPLVLWSLVAGGVVLIVFEIFHGERADARDGIATMPYRHAFLIGLCQAAAMVPGVSRSAATIVAGLALGWKRAAVVEFSFLLGAPTLAAATGYDLIKSASTFSSQQLTLIFIGFAAAFITALAAIHVFLAYVKRYNFTPFGIYRVILGLVLLSWLGWF